MSDFKKELLVELLDRNWLRGRAQLPLLNLSLELERAIDRRNRQMKYDEFAWAFQVVKNDVEEIIWAKLASRRRRLRDDHAYQPTRTGMSGWGNRIYVQRILDRLVRKRWGLTRLA